MGHLTKKVEIVSLITVLIGKLSRMKEELPKNREESNGSKMRRIGARDFSKRLRSAENKKKKEENKTEKILKQESRPKNREEKPS